MNNETAAKLTDHLNANRKAMLDRLKELVNMETPSLEKPLLDAMAVQLCNTFAQFGQTKVLPMPDRGNHFRLSVSAATKSAAKPALVIGHFDTVWASGTIAHRPFRVDGGRLTGPGAYDMKGGIVVLEFALRAMRELGIGLARDVEVLFNSDEEIGSPSSRPIIEALAAGAQYVLLLEGAGPAGTLKTARKGAGRFLVEVTGKAAHAGADPEKGVSAIHELAAQVTALAAMNDLAGSGISVNVGIISGGTRPNVTAASAQAQVDVRAWTSADARKIEQAVLSIKPVNPRAHVRVTGGIERPPMETTPATLEYFERARKLAAVLGQDLQQGRVGGASDGNFTAALGLPTLDGLGVVGDGGHAESEYVIVDSLPHRAALLVALLEGL